MFYPRLLEEKIQKTWKQTKVLLLVGPRQVGKSTILRHLYPNYQNIVLDPVQDAYNLKNDSDLFLKSFSSPLILDEVQYYPNIFSSLKRKVDETSSSQQYILTGSQNFSMLKQISESMAGRVIILNLYPFTFLEKEKIKNPLWIESYLKQEDLIKSLETAFLSKDVYTLMWQGGLPGLLEKEESFYQDYFNSYIQTYIERDMRLLLEIKNIYDFSKFMRLLALLSAQEINYAQLGRDLGIANSTAISWKNALQASLIYTEIEPYFGNTIKRLSKKPKGYFFDTGLLCYLNMIQTPLQLVQHPKVGSIFETYIINEISRYLKAKMPSTYLYHWRTTSQQEVDLVLEYGGILYPLEIKLKSYISKSDIRGIESFFQLYKDKSSPLGVIVYAGEKCHFITERIMAVPWNSICRS